MEKIHEGATNVATSVTERILFTSEEEAEKAGYARLSPSYYGDNEYEKEDDTVITYLGHTIRTDDSILTDNGDYFYIDDTSNYFMCDSCDSIYSVLHTGDSEVTTGRGQVSTWCEHCVQDAIYCDGDYYSESEFERRGGHYSDRRDEYTFDDEDDDEDSCLDGYHNGSSKDMSNGSHLRFGMEIEKDEICGDSDDHDSYKSGGWRCEEDGSVAAEYITPILSLDNIEDSIDWMMSRGKPIINGRIDRSCGGHVHISTKNINVENTVEFYKKVRLFMPLLWAIYPSRAINNFCNKNKNPLSSERYYKYQDCTPHPYYGSVEIRIFPGVDNVNTIRFRLGLCKIIAKKSEELMGKDADYKSIIEYIKSSTELMEVLSIVYNTPEKIHTLVERIIPAYNEAIESNSENYRLTKASALAKKLEEFVHDKNLPSVDE